MDKQLYFAYGSNLDPEQMKERCPDSQFLCVAYLPNYKLVFNTAPLDYGPAADMVFKPNSKVWGAVFLVSDADLAKLDHCEGTDDPDDPTGYLRQKVVVYRQDGRELVVWTYFVREKHEEGIPSAEDYLSSVVEGAKYHGLPAEYLQFLEVLYSKAPRKWAR